MLKTFADFRIQIPSGRGGEVDTVCPECSPTRRKKHAKCLSVNVEKGVWLCAHCGWKGTLAEGADRPNTDHWHKPKFRRPEPLPESNPDPLLDWFAERGITAEVVQRNGITAQTVWMPQVEDRVKAIAFPYFRGEELVNVKYRDRQKNFRMEAGAERVFFGLNDIEARCTIVEGEMDKLAVEVAGITSCISVPDGAPAENAKDYASKFSFLEADQDRLDAVTEWIIAVDNDAPGKRLEDELARRLGRDKCKRVVWPSGCKDANDVLLAHGSDRLRECIEAAVPYPLAGVFEVADLGDRIDILYEKGWEKGVSTGWAEVDDLYTVRPGEFTVITGMPNSGKSNWLDALAVNLAATHGWRFAVFSPENQPLEDHMARMIEKYIGCPFTDGPTPRMDKASLDLGKGWVNDHFFWVLPEDDNEWTIETVLDRAKSLVRRKGITGLIIDPWNELEHVRPSNLTETEYISQVLKHVRQFARRNGVHVWIVAHPTKMYRSKDGEYPVPTLYDISGSGHWRNKADNGIVVYRDFAEPLNPVEVHVQKIRFRQIGKLGMARLAYKAATATYFNPNSVLQRRKNGNHQWEEF